MLHLGRDLVRLAAEIDSEINSADLRESWNIAWAVECGDSGQRRALTTNIHLTTAFS